jgi:hypothetical protein
MNPTGGGSYRVVLDQFINTGSLSNFKITATDNAGNIATNSPGWNVNVEECGGGS